MSPTLALAARIRRGIDAVAGAKFEYEGQPKRIELADLRWMFLTRTYETAWVTASVTPSVTASVTGYSGSSEIVSANQ
jgi:hypothetical protein